MMSKGNWNRPQCPLFCNKNLETCSTSDPWKLLLFGEVTTGNVIILPFPWYFWWHLQAFEKGLLTRLSLFLQSRAEGLGSL